MRTAAALLFEELKCKEKGRVIAFRIKNKNKQSFKRVCIHKFHSSIF